MRLLIEAEILAQNVVFLAEVSRSMASQRDCASASTARRQKCSKVNRLRKKKNEISDSPWTGTTNSKRNCRPTIMAVFLVKASQSQPISASQKKAPSEKSRRSLSSFARLVCHASRVSCGPPPEAFEKIDIRRSNRFLEDWFKPTHALASSPGLARKHQPNSGPTCHQRARPGLTAPTAPAEALWSRRRGIWAST